MGNTKDKTSRCEYMDMLASFLLENVKEKWLISFLEAAFLFSDRAEKKDARSISPSFF